MSNSNLIPFKTSNAEGLFVKVPAGAYNFVVGETSLHYKIWFVPQNSLTWSFFEKANGFRATYQDIFDDGNGSEYDFLCLASEITEDQAGEICKFSWKFVNAKEAFKELMESLGALTGSWSVILKKQKAPVLSEA